MMEPRIAVLELAPKRATWIVKSLAQCGVASRNIEVVRVHAGLESLPTGTAAIIGSGGPGSAREAGAPTERGRILHAARSIFQDAIGSGIPILGICLSHQLLALANGGRVCSRANGLAVGFETVHVIQGDDLFAGLPKKFCVAQFHRDEVAEVPAGWEILAQSESCRVEAMRRRDRHVWSLQGHPELPEPFVGDLLANARNVSSHLATRPSPTYDSVRLAVLRRFLALVPARRIQMPAPG